MAANESIRNIDVLPLRMHGGSWQLRKRLRNGKRIEVSLRTTNRATAEQRARKLMAESAEIDVAGKWAAHVAVGMLPGGWLRRIHAGATARSRKRNAECLPLSALEMIAVRSGGRCEVSGLPFELSFGARQPMQPSIDRIDAKRGYELNNVRLVCLAVNYCMLHWGETVFTKIAAGTMQRVLQRLSEGGSSAGSGSTS